MKSTLLSFLLTMIAFGGTVNPVLDTLPDNTCLDLGLYGGGVCQDRTGVSNCYAITDFSGFVYDSDRQLMLMMGGGHASTARTDVDAFSFDSLKWSSEAPTTPCSDQIESNMDPDGHWITTGQPYSAHTYDKLAYCPNVKKMAWVHNYYNDSHQPTAVNSCIAANFPDGFIPGTDTKGHVYDCQTQTWAPTQGHAILPGGSGEYGASEYDPVSGRVIYVSQYSFYTYDPVEDSLVKHSSWVNPNVRTAGELVYFPPNDKFYYFSTYACDTIKIVEIALDRSHWENISLTTLDDVQGDLSYNMVETGYAYDSVNQVIGGGFRNDSFFVFDPVANTYSGMAMNMDSTATSFANQQFHCIDYDPVNNVFVFIAAPEGKKWLNRTYAYRYKRANTGAVQARVGVSHSVCGLTAVPNPFNPSTQLHYQMQVDANVTVTIYDAAGRQVRSLYTGFQKAGHHQVGWNGRNTLHQAMPSGVYFARLTSNHRTVTQKICLFR
jgi:hypothetical protein